MSKLIVNDKCYICGAEIKPKEMVYGIKIGTVTDTMRVYASMVKERKTPDGKVRIMWSTAKGSTRICHKGCLDDLMAKDKEM